MPRLGGLPQPHQRSRQRYDEIIHNQGGRPLAPPLAATFEADEPEEGTSDSENKPKGGKSSKNTP
jgi:hypothetical protein